MNTKVWTLSIRLFHWLLAIGFVAAYTLGDAESLRNLHYGFGLLVGMLLIFRIIYGFTGPRYANFKDFPISPKHQIDFFKNYFKKDKLYIGHNPAASIVMMLIFIVGIFASFSGYLLYSKEGIALFTTNINEEILEEAHEMLANLFLVLVGMHLLGLLSDYIFHRQIKTLNSIFTGNKLCDGENVQTTKYQKVIGIFWIVIPLVSFFYGLQLTSESAAETEKSIEYIQEEDEEEDDD